MLKQSLLLVVTLATVGASTAIAADPQQPNLNLQPIGSVTVASKNLAAGQAFLAKNKTQPGVTVLPSGLQYKILKQSSGAKPNASSIVTVNYEGKLINGTVFDSSYQRGEPATFPLSNVIPGWQEALQMMPVGSIWEIVIPPQLAYGSRGAGNAIGPNETLIFKVHLLKIDS